MHFLLLPVFLIAFTQDSNQAEKAFRAAEKKLAEADNAQITVNATMKGGVSQFTMKGTLLLAKGNKARIDFNLDTPGGGFKFTSVSDGAKTKTEMAQGDKGGKESVRDTEKNANATFAGVTSRSGLLAGMIMVVGVGGPGKKQPELDDLVSVSDFMLGQKEKIGERQAQRIDYKLTVSAGPNNKETIKAQVWLDSETNLPLKRVLNGQKGDEKFEVTETYDIRLNGKIEASKFELPK